MKRNIKHHSVEATYSDHKQHHKTGGNEVNQQEHLSSSQTNLDGDGKNRKKYDRNEQKRLYLHRLH